MKYLPVIGLFLTASLPAASFAGAKDFVIHVTRLGGDTESARPYIAKSSAFFEQAMSWPKGSANGIFLPERPEAIARIQQSKPGFAILEPALYFELRKTEKLLPLAQLESKHLVSRKLHLVVLEKSWTSLDQLKQKRLWTTLAESPDYLSTVIFGGKVAVQSHFSLKKVGHALKGIRAVLRGKADATLLDDDMLAKAKQMKGGETLRTIYTSPELPPPLVVAFSEVMKPPQQKKLKRVLMSMCSSKEGAAVCKEIMITRFSPIENKVFQQAQRLYDHGARKSR